MWDRVGCPAVLEPAEVKANFLVESTVLWHGFSKKILVPRRIAGRLCRLVRSLQDFFLCLRLAVQGPRVLAVHIIFPSMGGTVHDANSVAARERDK